MDQMFFTRMISRLDRMRARTLKTCLAQPELRRIYDRPESRLLFGILLSTLIYLPLAIAFPELLLLFGPLLLGYPHLMASYRFVASKKFSFFALLTLIAIIMHLAGLGIGTYAEVPFGTWQIIVATLGLYASSLAAPKIDISGILFGTVVATLLLYGAWAKPIMFIGGMLILHNWVAYFFWILRAKDSATRKSALTATMIFFLIHVVVLCGWTDQFIPIVSGELKLGNEGLNTGQFLASWTSNPLVWYRFLVIYVFGLSMHYFVWLKAIPESSGLLKHPASFRRTVKDFITDLGPRQALVVLIASIIGIIFWISTPKLGARIYFELAILHGYIEILFFLSDRKTEKVYGAKKRPSEEGLA